MIQKIQFSKMNLSKVNSVNILQPYAIFHGHDVPEKQASILCGLSQVKQKNLNHVNSEPHKVNVW